MRKLEIPSPALVVSCLALLISLGPVAYAANTVFSTDIVDGDVKTADLGQGAVTNDKIAVNAIGPGLVRDNSLTSLDIRGADINGGLISLPAGSVANGRCRDVNAATPGATVGEAVILSLQAAAPEGMLFYGVRVSSANTVVFKVCNFTGVTSPAISNLPVRITTLG